MKQKIKSVILFIAILSIASVLRFTGINWDGGNQLHPDERFIFMTTTALDFQNDMNPHFFAYGSFPLYLLKLISTTTGKLFPQLLQYDTLPIIGRILSGLFDIGTLCCIYYLLHHLTKKKHIVYLGTLWYASSVLPIQLSHFYAVDTILTFFSCLTLFFTLRYYQHPSVRYALGIGIAVGLAIATKISAMVLIIPIGITFLITFPKNWKKTCLFGIIVGIAALYTFFITEPYAFLDFATFKQQLLDQQAMTKSAFTFPYTLQYVGKIPYLYEFKNIILWGQGVFLGIISFLGIIYGTKKAIQNKSVPTIILLVFFWVYTAIVGRFAIGFMRYMLPIYPILTIFAALLIQKCTQNIKPQKRMLIYGICTALIFFWTITFTQIYTKPNTRVVASAWIFKNIPRGATIALEHWDDALPLRFASRYVVEELPLYNADTTKKWNDINAQLQKTDYVIIASNRLYTPLMNMTDCVHLPQGRCYKTTADYYSKLFSGTLGFTKVATFTSFPTIPFTAIHIDDSAADESFTVYDHPKIMIFKKTTPYTPILLKE